VGYLGVLRSRWEKLCNVERTVDVTSECTGCSTALQTALLYHVTSERTGCSTAPHTAFSAVSLPTHSVSVCVQLYRHRAYRVHTL